MANNLRLKSRSSTSNHNTILYKDNVYYVV